MNKKYGWILGALVITVLAVVAFGTTTAFAHEGGPGGKKGGRTLEGAALEAAADLLNMSTDELTAALADGQNMRELAEAAGVDMQTIKDTLGPIREQAIRDRIAEGLADGSIDQDKADKILERLENGGFGGGRRGGGKPGNGEGFQRPGGNPSPDAGVSL